MSFALVLSLRGAHGLRGQKCREAGFYWNFLVAPPISFRQSLPLFRIIGVWFFYLGLLEVVMDVCTVITQQVPGCKLENPGNGFTR